MARLKFIVLTLTLLPWAARGQFVEPQADDYYERSMQWNMEPIRLPHVRGCDIYWERLVWRTIDVREKENQFFYFPSSQEGVRGRKNLAYVLWEAIQAGQIELYEDDELKVPIDGQLIIDRATRSDTVQMEVYDDWGEMSYQTVFIPHEFSSENIYQYALKEVVFLDKAKSGMQNRKLALAPMETQYREIEGEMIFLGMKPLFWIPMLSYNVRNLFVKKEAYIRDNLTRLPSWEIIFQDNMFSSFITRTDNIWNRKIHDYLTGTDAMLESERIEEEIMNIAWDMWEY